MIGHRQHGDHAESLQGVFEDSLDDVAARLDERAGLCGDFADI